MSNLTTWKSNPDTLNIEPDLSSWVIFFYVFRKNLRDQLTEYFKPLSANKYFLN